MAVNLINSSDIEVEQTGNNVQLKTSTPISTLEGGISDNTTNIQNIINGEKYSTTETLTNKVWINNKPIYRKVIDFGYLPNAAAKMVNHNISNIDKIVHQEFIASDSNGQTYSAPHVASPNMGNNMTMSLRSSKEWVQVYCSANMTTYTGYYTIEYTKTN